jgi:hypothetical protein
MKIKNNQKLKLKSSENFKNLEREFLRRTQFVFFFLKTRKMSFLFLKISKNKNNKYNIWNCSRLFKLKQKYNFLIIRKIFGDIE